MKTTQIQKKYNLDVTNLWLYLHRYLVNVYTTWLTAKLVQWITWGCHTVNDHLVHHAHQTFVTRVLKVTMVTGCQYISTFLTFQVNECNM